MSAESVEPTGCAHGKCIDDDHVTVEFPGGARRDYCEYHGGIVVSDSDAEVIEDV